MQSKNDAEQIKLKVSVGAAMATNIAVAGIALRDKISSIIGQADLSGDYLINPSVVGIGSTPTAIATTAFQFAINGLDETKAAVAAGTAFSAANTINTAEAAGTFWGAWLLQITTGGTLSTKSVGADQVYDTEAEAIAALPVADADNVAVGYVTVNSSTDVDWVALTDNLTDASGCTEANFYSYEANVPNGNLDETLFAVTSAGYIQSATVDTSGQVLTVLYIDRSAG